MNTEMQNFFAQLNLKQSQANLFVSDCKNNGWQQIFGGQIMAQALTAAGKNLNPEWQVQSYQANFLLPGDLKKPVFYRLTPIREGKRICVLQVTASQNDKTIFQLTATLSNTKTETLEHQDLMPDVPPPEHCADLMAAENAYRTRFPEHFVNESKQELPPTETDESILDMRFVDLDSFFATASEAGPISRAHAVWIKLNAELPNDSDLHVPILAFISDMGIAPTIVQPHNLGAADPRLRFISLNHCMWFHRSFRVDDWLLFVRRSPTANSGRGLVTADVFRQDGALLATFVQQGLVQLRA